MALIGRIIVIWIALIAAIIAAGVTFALGMLLQVSDSDPVDNFIFFGIAFFTTTLAVMIAFLPSLLLIAIAEVTRIRTILYYGAAGMAIGLLCYFNIDLSLSLQNTTDIAPPTNLLQLAAAAGIIGGLVYWLIAGRSAGRWRDPLNSLT